MIMIYDQLIVYDAYNLLGHHEYNPTPIRTTALVTAAALFTSECEYELLHCIKKYACVNVFNFIYPFYYMIIIVNILNYKISNESTK